MGQELRGGVTKKLDGYGHRQVSVREGVKCGSGQYIP